MSHEIPVLSEEVASIDFTEFAGRLSEWADGWIDDLAVSICKASRELYEDKAIVLLLSEWHKYKQHYEISRSNYLYDIATTGEPSFPFNDEDSYDKHRMTEYSQALYAILARR